MYPEKQNSSSEFDDLMTSTFWQENLRDLNEYLIDSLERAGEPPVLEGNLFYGHMARDFHKSGYLERADTKRRNFFKLAQKSNCLFEIGVNGGHSLLLALLANPELKCIGVDICARPNKKWAPVEVYVPAAFNWLKYKFADRVQLIKGNSLIEAPTFQINKPNTVVDMLHLDGAKNTHLREVLALNDLLPSGAFIVHDDINLRAVRISDRQLRKLGITQPIDYTSTGLLECSDHVVRVKR